MRLRGRNVACRGGCGRSAGLRRRRLRDRNTGNCQAVRGPKWHYDRDVPVKPGIIGDVCHRIRKSGKERGSNERV